MAVKVTHARKSDGAYLVTIGVQVRLDAESIATLLHEEQGVTTRYDHEDGKRVQVTEAALRRALADAIYRSIDIDSTSQGDAGAQTDDTVEHVIARFFNGKQYREAS